MNEISYPNKNPNQKPQKELWNERYSKNDYLYGKAPCSLVEQFAPHLTSGKLLDVACGEGRNGVYLAQKGFEVLGVDCSDKAIEKASKLATDTGVKADFKLQNLDFYILDLMKYQTIVMTYFKPSVRFFSEIRRGLSQGGTFLLEAHTTEHAKANPNHPLIDVEHCFRPNECLHALKDFHILYYKEIAEQDKHLVQCIAQKVQK